jgi:tetratricopeptide (TPR) repeat protein
MADVARGWELFGLADWQGARDAFQSALDTAPGDPDAIDGLGQASWWMGERDVAIEYRREAFAGYRRAGSSRDAARLAIRYPPERASGHRPICDPYSCSQRKNVSRLPSRSTVANSRVPKSVSPAPPLRSTG